MRVCESNKQQGHSSKCTNLKIYCLVAFQNFQKKSGLNCCRPQAAVSCKTVISRYTRGPTMVLSQMNICHLLQFLLPTFSLSESLLLQAFLFIFLFFFYPCGQLLSTEHFKSKASRMLIHSWLSKLFPQSNSVQGQSMQSEYKSTKKSKVIFHILQHPKKLI